MARMTERIEIQPRLRPCVLDEDIARKSNIEEKALFHQWIYDKEGRCYGVLELEDGHVVKVASRSFRFLDTKEFMAAFNWENKQ